MSRVGLNHCLGGRGLSGDRGASVHLRRLRAHYRALVAESRAKGSVTIPIPVEKLEAVRRSPSAARDLSMWLEDERKRRVARRYPIDPDTRVDLKRRACEAVDREGHELDLLWMTPARMDLFMSHPALAGHLGVDLDSVPGILMKRWFGGERRRHPVLDDAGHVIGWRESRTGHTELPTETKAALFSAFEQRLWPRWLRLRRPGESLVGRKTAGRDERETIAWSTLRGMLVRSYRKAYSGGRGGVVGRLRNEPLHVWTLPPKQILPLLVGSVLVRAEKERRMGQHAARLLKQDGSARDDLEAGALSWPEAFALAPPKSRIRHSGAGPAQMAELWDRALAGPGPVKRMAVKRLGGTSKKST